jgi:tetratricopeptide (TPR) repeat protein
MSARLLCCALATLLACSCSVPRPRAPAGTPEGSDFEAAIGRLQEKDPASPAILSAKLAYAQFLLRETAGACAQRLTRAQEELGSVAANPETHVMFPDGWALVASLEYQQHLGRAACGGQSERRDELLAAIEAARRAVARYRRAFDYHSMVIMQFDTALALRQVGEAAAATAALEQALRMDREFGFEEDARENTRLLLGWRGEPAGAARVARLMEGFPQRRVTLKFGWHPVDARITLEDRRVSLDRDRIVHSRASATFERRIAPAPTGGWSITHAHRLSGYEPGVWPSERDSGRAQLVFPPAPLPAADFKVGAGGEFEGVTQIQGFSTRLTERTDRIIHAGTPAGNRVDSALQDVIEKTAVDFSPGMLEADTAQAYQLETAMWIGATLEQGVWYQLSAPLFLPGGSQFIVEQRMEFAFTRKVACATDTAARKCIEIVIRMTPEPQALSHALTDAGGPPPYGFFSNYFASTLVRIVTDPATLLPYAREERVYWYAAVGGTASDAILESEHLLLMMRYARASLTPPRAPSHDGNTRENPP